MGPEWKSGWKPVCVAILLGLIGAGVVPASGPARDATDPVGVQPVRLGSPDTPTAVKYRLRVDAVAYHLPGRTALGVPVGVGVVAVDPKLIPLGTRLHVPGYGPGLAADVGVAIKGRIIDLWMPSTAKARKWGRRTVTITVYR